MLIRIISFAVGILALTLAIGILTTAPFSKTKNDATYPVASLLCLTSIGCLLAVREGELNDDLKQKLRWAKCDARSNEMMLEQYRATVISQNKEIDNLQLDNAFLREKYHKDIEGAKYETV